LKKLKRFYMESKELTASYTKGEWYLQKFTDAYTNIIRCNNGKHEKLFIASTPQSDLAEARANAQLISAAPDLLESLQEIIAITDRDHVAWAKAKAAIDKALKSQAAKRPTCTNSSGCTDWGECEKNGCKEKEGSNA
jgi:hypothetical protein